MRKDGCDSNRLRGQDVPVLPQYHRMWYSLRFCFFSFYFIILGRLDLGVSKVKGFENFVTLVSNVGFPIVVALYLLIRFEKIISELCEAVRELTFVIKDRYKENKD